MGSPLLTPKNIAKRARAYENMVYVVSANSAGIEGIPFPAASTDGASQVVNYKGDVLAAADTGESMCGNAEIDIGALRRVRLLQLDDAVLRVVARVGGERLRDDE